MIAATNRLKDYPTRIVYERQPLRAKHDWVVTVCWAVVGLYSLVVPLGLWKAVEIAAWLVIGN